MNLQRYNQIVFALLGTAALLGAAWLVFIASRPGHFLKNGADGVIVQHDDRPKPQQNLVFCPSAPIENSTFEYFPVAAVVERDKNEAPILDLSPRVSKQRLSVFSNCRLGEYGRYGRVFNVVIRNATSGDERVLLSQPGQIDSLQGPSAKCASGEGEMPCGLLLWKIRPADANHDGAINDEDALVAYVSDLSGTDLHPVTQPDATVLDASWSARSGRLRFQLQADANKDGKFSDEDGAVIVETDAAHPASAQPAFKAPTIEQLQKVLK